MRVVFCASENRRGYVILSVEFHLRHKRRKMGSDKARVLCENWMIQTYTCVNGFILSGEMF